MNTHVFKGQRTIWSNRSVLDLLKKEGLPGEEPEDIIRRKARALVRDALKLGWEGPPFNPEVLASLVGIEVLAAEDPIGSEARIFPMPDGKVRIEYDRSYPQARINFSINHELIHTFFPDCYEMVRHRKRLSPHEAKHKELELLCDLGSAELLMPVTPFTNDLALCGASLQSILSLAEQYGASTEATMIRVTQCADGDFATVILSEKLKPSERRVAQNGVFEFANSVRPKLRVDYCNPANSFTIYVPKDKSVPDDSVAYRAFACSGVHERIESWDIPGFAPRRVQAIALPAVNGVKRVGIFICGDGD